MSQAGLLCECALVPCFWARHSLPTLTFFSSQHYYQTHKCMHDPLLSPTVSCSLGLLKPSKVLWSFWESTLPLQGNLGTCPFHSRATSPLTINEVEPQEQTMGGKLSHTSTLTSLLTALSVEWARTLPSSQNYLNLCFLLLVDKNTVTIKTLCIETLSFFLPLQHTTQHTVV